LQGVAQSAHQSGRKRRARTDEGHRQQTACIAAQRARQSRVALAQHAGFGFAAANQTGQKNAERAFARAVRPDDGERAVGGARLRARDDLQQFVGARREMVAVERIGAGLDLPVALQMNRTREPLPHRHHIG